MEKIINDININEMTAHNLFDRGNAAAMQTVPNMITMPSGIKIITDEKAMMCDPGLGICFVPVQGWEQLYDEDTAFSAGTVFPCLDKPFLGGGK